MSILFKQFLFNKKKNIHFRHFAFISFVNENTALDVLRQHAIVPLTFQNRPIILAPAYKKPSIPSVTSMFLNFELLLDSQ